MTHPMRPIRETIPLDEALGARLRAGGARRAHRARADSRRRTAACSPKPRSRRHDVPPFDRAAMDGYAVVAEDTFGAGRYDPKILRCVEKVYTGQVPTRAIASGECTEIATGAPMPAGADAVVMVEETEKGADGDGARLHAGVSAAARRPAGRRHRRRPGAARAGRRAEPEPHRRARGDRACSTSRCSRSRASRSSRPATRSSSPASRSAPGRSTTSTVHARDDHRGARRRAVHGPHRARQPAGAESRDRRRRRRGHRRLLRRQLGRRARPDHRRAPGDRARCIFHGIAVKPGKPTVFGRIGGEAGARHARLPDVVPVERLHAARAAAAPDGAAAGVPRRRSCGCRSRAASSRRPAGTSSTRCESRTARPTPAFKASGDITSMSHADGYIEIPAQTDIVEAGEMVDVKLF